jgi:hypothetical protein
MKVSTLLLAGLIAIALAGSASSDQRRRLSLTFADRAAWKVFADEPWWALVDIRDMLNVFHPFSLPHTGNAAGASRKVTIPAEWKPPFALRFYCADDYFADAEKHKPGQLGTESFFEHRFKQALVDDVVVWSRDVTDDNVFGSQTIFQVNIGPYVTAGKPFTLTFRVFDKVSTLERNDRDVWFIGGTWYTAGDGKTEEEPRFHTAVWFADPVIGEQAAVAAAPAGTRPHEAVVAAGHRARWPIAPPSEQMRPPAKLELVAPAAIPAPGFPITCGIPMPPGLLTDGRAVRLRDRSGRDLPIQTRAAGWWPDGSIRWVLLSTIAPADAAPGDRFRLWLNEGRGPAPQVPLKVVRRGQHLSIATGPIRLELGRDPKALIDAVYLTGNSQPALTDLAVRMSVAVDGATTPVSATWQRIEVIDRGPVAARIELSGSLRAAERHIGRFLFRLYAYAGLPSVQTNFRIFDDVKPEPYRGTADDAPLDVTDLALVAHIPGGIRGETAIGIEGAQPLRSGPGGLSVLQDSDDHFAATTNGGPMAEGRHAQGWISISSGGCVQASVWRFWQQYPKSLKADRQSLEIGLFAPSEKARLYRPRFGEAKRHDIWLAFSRDAREPDTQKALGLLADEPPRLFDGEWFCLSGGVNLLDPHWFDNQPQLKQYIANAYGDVSTGRVTGEFGIRSFGDMPYGAKGQWRNGYWAMVQGALNWGLASGDQRWLQRSFEIARHIADIDCIHIGAGHLDWSEWAGITCALGYDHSVHNDLAKWPAFQIGESLILHYWMTGDPESLEAAVANAEYITRSRAGLGSSEARSQARPMLTLLRVWEATGNRKYREAAARYLDVEFQRQHVMDWRRGAYIEPTYENWRCISAGLDSMYAQNAYEYYRLTGDVRAAQLVVAVADSVYAESMLPQEEGLGSFIFYVRYSRGAWYYTQMALLFHMAYDLTEDIRFLRAGRAALARYLLCADSKGNRMYQPFHNFGWLDPEFGGWQRHFRRVVTEPFNITSQTPIPDPAHYER